MGHDNYECFSTKLSKQVFAGTLYSFLGNKYLAMDQCVRVVLNPFSEVAGGSENIIQCLSATLQSSWVKCQFDYSTRFSLFCFSLCSHSSFFFKLCHLFSYF